ncbi:hypothetical protein EUTSA_v10001540mg [Eutrema salsugineum]|uniref:RRM domain-containing protein n=2 Tax=Eutrema salsugineum TaxID=72664 RepID=V4N2A7_EUTSA|nr:hypothetical protein EUTSA_v10001540mg [Eutrema salsugineum]
MALQRIQNNLVNCVKAHLMYRSLQDKIVMLFGLAIKRRKSNMKSPIKQLTEIPNMFLMIEGAKGRASSSRVFLSPCFLRDSSRKSISSASMRPVFVGNFEYDTRQSDLERLFGKYGRVERVDMKSGYAFVYFEDERDAEDAIRGIDNTPFGYEKRKLSVEWAKGERGKPRDGRSASNQRPTKTLFVINFDPIRTKERDIERHFEPYGKVLNVRIRRNFAFVQFATQEDATKALDCTQNSKIMDRVVSIEYALRDDDEREDRYAASPRRRSPSPVYRRRPSPDYGRPRSPEYDRYKGPAPYERRRSPDYGRRSPDYGRARSPGYDRYRSRSPYGRARG